MKVGLPEARAGHFRGESKAGRSGAGRSEGRAGTQIPSCGLVPSSQVPLEAPSRLPSSPYLGCSRACQALGL